MRSNFPSQSRTDRCCEVGLHYGLSAVFMLFAAAFGQKYTITSQQYSSICTNLLVKFVALAQTNYLH